MGNFIIRISIIVGFLISVNQSAYSQNWNYCPTCNNGGNNNGQGHVVDGSGTGGTGHTHHGNGNGYGHTHATTQVPFDGGLLTLLGLGGALGIRKMRKNKK